MKLTGVAENTYTTDCLGCHILLLFIGEYGISSYIHVFSIK